MSDYIKREDAIFIALQQPLYSVVSQIKQLDGIDIVRCQDCKHWVYHFNGCSRNPCTEPWYATDFCNYGEREGE